MGYSRHTLNDVAATLDMGNLERVGASVGREIRRDAMNWERVVVICMVEANLRQGTVLVMDLSGIPIMA